MNGRHNVHATHDKSLQRGQQRLIKTALNHHFDQGMSDPHITINLMHTYVKPFLMQHFLSIAQI